MLGLSLPNTKSQKLPFFLEGLKEEKKLVKMYIVVGV
jgi:hypothetical protein